MWSKPNNSKILMNDFERLNSKKVSFIDAPVYYPLALLLEMSHIATMNQLFLAIVRLHCVARWYIQRACSRDIENKIVFRLCS